MPLEACRAMDARDQSFSVKLSKSSIERVLSAFADLDLGDPRRASRVRDTVARLATDPGASVPAAMGSDANIEGAYRLMNSRRVSMEALNDAHARATAERARVSRRVLAIHDTTTCAFQHADAAVVGYLNTGKAGFMVHYTLVVAADGSKRPLGVANVEAVVRTRPPRRRKVKGRSRPRRSSKERVRDKDRESTRWYRGFQRTSERLHGCQVVHVADREGDNYELFAQALVGNERFVVRARVLQRRVETGAGKQLLSEAVERCRTVLVREVDLTTRTPSALPSTAAHHPGRRARQAHLEISATRVTLRRPHYQDASLPESIELNVVRVFEPNPPLGEPPVEWVLYTTEPISSAKEVAEIVDIYRARWLIEECNKALKTGCRYEERHFESRAALLTLLAMTLPIACEVLALRASCRADPKRPAAEVLTPTQMQVLAAMGSRPLPKNPSVHDALWAVAALGGHIKSNGQPGWLVLQRGMTKLLAYEEGWCARERASGTRARLSIS